MNARMILFRFCTLLVITSFLAACSTKTPSPTLTPANTPVPELTGMDKLIADAKAEGTLTTMALPHDWCNYGKVIETFKTKYGMQVNELNPNAGSGDEIDAVKALRDKTVTEAPDTLDVGFGFGPQLIEEKLTAPYKVATWDTLPYDLSDPEGYWFGGYYGVLAFEVNKNIIKNPPQDWSDLLKPEYKGQIALAGDPLVSSQAQMSIYAAALANGGSLDNVMPGLEFFKKLNEASNFVPLIAKPDKIATGQTPITIRWDYNALSNKKASKGTTEIEVIIPKTGIIAGVYIQAISAYAQHPNAARLWMEFLYSDEGQLIWLEGGCHPIRYNDLVRRKAIPLTLLPELPPAEPYSRAAYPSIKQLNTAKQTIIDNWMKIVGVEVK